MNGGPREGRRARRRRGLARLPASATPAMERQRRAATATEPAMATGSGASGTTVQPPRCARTRPRGGERDRRRQQADRGDQGARRARADPLHRDLPAEQAAQGPPHLRRQRALGGADPARPDARAAARDGHRGDGEVMDPDPFLAVQDAVRIYHPDEIIISTYPYPRSGWLRRDLVERIRELLEASGRARGRRPQDRAGQARPRRRERDGRRAPADRVARAARQRVAAPLHGHTPAGWQGAGGSRPGAGAARAHDQGAARRPASTWSAR